MTHSGADCKGNAKRNEKSEDVPVAKKPCQATHWADLVPELIESVMYCLDDIEDRRNLSLVNKHWHTKFIQCYLSVTTNLQNELPFLVSIPRGGKKLYLNEPHWNMKSIVYTPDITFDAKIKSSKKGWLLIAQGETSIFFYNPVTETKIDLPNVVNARQAQYCVSTSPTSSDCTVISIFVSEVVDSMEIKCCRHGDKVWTSSGIWDHPLPFLPSYVSPIFYRECFYFVGMDGCVGVLNPEWNKLTVLPWPCDLDYFYPRQCSIAESGGDLLLVLMWINNFRLYKLDLSSQQLVPVTDLKGHTLYVGGPTSIDVDDDHTWMKNEIFIPRFRGKGCLYYSLADHRLHPDFYGSREILNACWAELDWCVPSPSKTKLLWSE